MPSCAAACQAPSSITPASSPRVTQGMTTSFAVADHVSRAANRMQQCLGKTFINLRTQPRDVHIDDVGLGIEMVIPHVLQQHCAGHNLSGMLHEVFEQAELARL